MMLLDHSVKHHARVMKKAPIQAKANEFRETLKGFIEGSKEISIPNACFDKPQSADKVMEGEQFVHINMLKSNDGMNFEQLEYLKEVNEDLEIPDDIVAQPSAEE